MRLPTAGVAAWLVIASTAIASDKSKTDAAGSAGYLLALTTYCHALNVGRFPQVMEDRHADAIEVLLAGGYSASES